MKKLLLLVGLLLVGMTLGCSGAATSTTTISSTTTTQGTTTTTQGTTTTTQGTTTTTLAPWVDYAAQLSFDKDTTGKVFTRDGYGEVVLDTCVDGDTVHFRDKTTNEKIKARFLQVNTPESTGKIEEWGKKASRYTCDRVTNAKKIVLSSIGNKAEHDSSGDRYLSLVWVDGVNINLELVQEGLAQYKHVAGSQYNDIFLNADFQAQAYKLNIWSGQPDPDFYYGASQYIDLRELKENADKYMGTRVTVEGVVTRKVSADAYIEETIEGKQYGIYLFANYNAQLIPIGRKGNRVKVSGILSEYYGALQLVDLTYNDFKPGPNDIELISQGNVVNPTEVTIDMLDFAKDPYLAQTLISLKDVTCTSGKNEDSGSFNVYCTVGGKNITLRFDGNILQNYKDADGNKITSYEYFVGKTMDVIGICDVYYDDYQIEIISTNDLVIK